MLQPQFQKNINNILKITKNLIKTDDKFNKYMIKEDNQMIKEQFPVLIPNFLKKIKKKEEEKKLNLCRMNRSNSTVEYYFPKHNYSLSNFQNIEDSKLQSSRTFFKKNNNQINLNKILEKKHLKLLYIKSKSEKDLFCNSLILNDILIDTKKNLFKNNNFIIYNENEIFFKNYKERIEKSLEFIKKNYSNYKNNNIGEEPYNKTKLYKILHKDSNKQIEISINFVSINIKSLEQNENTFYQNVNLPIFFTPLFYLNSEKNIPYILGSIFKEEDILKLLINENFLNVIVNKDSFKNVDEEYKKNYNKFKYLWITENNSFEIEVTMPKIIIKIKKTNTIIEKFIEDKLFFYLFCNEMKNWFDYIINYLFSYKKFRNIIDSITSKIIIKNKYENQKIILDEIRIKNQNFNEKKLVFLYSDNKSENYVFYFKPIVLNIPLNYNFQKKQTKFKKIKFKIGELMFLVRTTNYFDDTLEFLLKFIEIEKEKNKCEFNYKKLNSIKEDFLKILQKKIQNNNNLNNNNNNLNNNNNNNNNLIEITANEIEKENKICFIKDTIFKLKLINQTKSDIFSNKIRFEVKLNLLNNLSKNNNIFNWGKDLRDLINELKKIKENLELNKEFTKRSSSIRFSKLKRIKSLMSNKSLIKFRQSSSIKSLKKE